MAREGSKKKKGKWQKAKGKGQNENGKTAERQLHSGEGGMMTEVERLARQITQLTREMVVEMGVGPARELARRARELSKEYPLGNRTRIAMRLAADQIMEVADSYEADDYSARLAKREKRLVRLWVAEVGVKRAREGALGLLESAKEYPPGDWKGVSFREIAEETLEVVQGYEAAGWTGHDNAKAERLNALAQAAGLGQNPAP